MLADGYGPHVHTMARDVARHFEDDSTLRLPLDDHLVGSSATMPVCNRPLRRHTLLYTRRYIAFKVQARTTSNKHLFWLEAMSRCG
jgi:hypothetical protein